MFRRRGSSRLKQANLAEVGLHEDVLHGGHNKLDVVGIGGTREVGIYMLGLDLVQALESAAEVVGALVKVTPP